MVIYGCLNPPPKTTRKRPDAIRFDASRWVSLRGLRLPGIVLRVLGSELLQDVGAVGGDSRFDDVVLLGDRLVFVAELACRVLGVGFLVDQAGDGLAGGVRGPWLSPQNVRRQWRQARAGPGLAWGAPAPARTTGASHLDSEARA